VFSYLLIFFGYFSAETDTQIRFRRFFSTKIIELLQLEKKSRTFAENYK